MKKLNLFSFALAALMLGACSNELDVKGTDSGGVLPGEKGYVSLAINLPTTPNTRVNDDFNDGEESEYKVNDATLLIFSGTQESSATFSGAYDLKATFMDQPTNGQISTTAKIIQEIENNIQNSDFKIEDLADTQHISRTVFYRKIKSLTGSSPIDLVQEIRIKKAIDFLQKGNLRVSEIAYRCGFSSPQYFSRVFKEKTGQSPTEYKGGKND